MRPPPSAPHTRPAPQPADAPPCPPRSAGRARPAAYEKLTRRFAREWTERNGGRKLYFRLSFGGSGTQTRAIIDGLPVDIFSPALEADLLKVEDEEYLDAGWQARLPNRGIVAETVIVLVTRGDECLLGRNGRWPDGRYSTLAGFVEFGETLEECVLREMEEEAGVLCDRSTLRFVASQPWLFPRSILRQLQCY